MHKVSFRVCDVTLIHGHSQMGDTSMYIVGTFRYYFSTFMVMH